MSERNPTITALFHTQEDYEDTGRDRLPESVHNKMRGGHAQESPYRYDPDEFMPFLENPRTRRAFADLHWSHIQSPNIKVFDAHEHLPSQERLKRKLQAKYGPESSE